RVVDGGVVEGNAGRQVGRRRRLRQPAVPDRYGHHADGRGNQQYPRSPEHGALLFLWSEQRGGRREGRRPRGEMDRYWLKTPSLSNVALPAVWVSVGEKPVNTSCAEVTLAGTWTVVVSVLKAVLVNGAVRTWTVLSTWPALPR